MQLIMSLIGMVVLVLVAVLLSSNRKAIRLRTVLGAFLLQIGIGALCASWPQGTGRDDRRCCPDYWLRQ